jgi:CDP-diacylglycerol--serine O-phosphatidyltransferase
LGFGLVSQDPPKVLFGVFVLYGLSGYLMWCYNAMTGKQTSVVKAEASSESGNDSSPQSGQ